jgi:hypothetical protein
VQWQSGTPDSCTFFSIDRFTELMRNTMSTAGTDAQTEKALQWRKEFALGRSCRKHRKRSILTIEAWEGTSAFWLLRFLWVLLSPDYLKFTASKSSIERAILTSKMGRTLELNELAGLNLIAWRNAKRGTERVQTLCGIYVNMVGPTGFEPVTKRL